MMFNLGPYQDKVDARMEQWKREKLATRLWERDPTLWFSMPVPELADRLGWLSLGESMRPQIGDIVDFAHEIREEGVAQVVLIGMGGSSLAPRVFQETFGNKQGYPSLTVLDSTHPATIREVRGGIDPSKTLFIVSSKSGTTLETLSLFRFFWDFMRTTGNERGRHFIAITDHGTPLAKLASERGFRRIFEATPDVGGRYSALTAFGLVPAALIGVNVFELLDSSFRQREGGPSDPAGHAHGLVLGAALGELAVSGRDKVTLLTSKSVRSFPSWIEQLIAESTGKDGKGIVPIINEPLLDPSSYPSDRFFMGIGVEGEESEIEDRLRKLSDAGHPTVEMKIVDKMHLGHLMLDWEIAVASAAIILGIHPFNQPDVQMTKDLTRKMMGAGGTKEHAPEGVRTIYIDDLDALRGALEEWSSMVKQGDYISIQAYLHSYAEVTKRLQLIRAEILHHLDVATTLAYGPGFLHSTGQLHKGGSNTGLFIQLIDGFEEDLDVPETDYTFGDLIHASSLGDYMALKHLGRRVLRIDLGKDIPAALLKLEAEVNGLVERRKIMA